MKEQVKEPVKAGDRCRVVGGLGGAQSPNLGCEVVVEFLEGEHSRYGRIWHCTGRGVKQLTDGGSYAVTNAASFAACWLEKQLPVSGHDEHYLEADQEADAGAAIEAASLTEMWCAQVFSKASCQALMIGKNTIV